MIIRAGRHRAIIRLLRLQIVGGIRLVALPPAPALQELTKICTRIREVEVRPLHPIQYFLRLLNQPRNRSSKQWNPETDFTKEADFHKSNNSKLSFLVPWTRRLQP